MNHLLDYLIIFFIHFYTDLIYFCLFNDWIYLYILPGLLEFFYLFFHYSLSEPLAIYRITFYNFSAFSSLIFNFSSILISRYSFFSKHLEFLKVTCVLIFFFDIFKEWERFQMVIIAVVYFSLFDLLFTQLFTFLHISMLKLAVLIFFIFILSQW